MDDVAQACTCRCGTYRRVLKLVTTMLLADHFLAEWYEMERPDLYSHATPTA